ncbi:MAG: dicarboxylate/amino acid:cation symporter [Gemmataceae bacterium]|nr:dicarboxylate/amino acid:cation symporter [Gemmataceae bacterium]
MHETKAKGIPLHTKILLALILGAALGITANYAQRPAAFQPKLLALLSVQPCVGLPFSALATAYAPAPPTWIDHLITYVMHPVGQIFLRLLFLTVIPLVFASLSVGVAQLGAMGNLGRIGLKTFVYFVLTMTMAVVIGLAMVNTVRPGDAITEKTKDRLMKEYGAEAAKRTGQPVSFGVNTFVQIVPQNPLAAMVNMDMLAVIFVALLVGVALTKIEPERSQHTVRLLEGVNEVMIVIIGWAMKIAPFGVFALIFTVTARFGLELLAPLAMYVLIVLVGIAVQMFVVLSILVATLARMSPLVFFRKVRAIMITAFSTSSSNATLPTTIKVSEEELGVPPAIAGFVLPLGATMNMNGTALFEGVTVVFLAQVFGVDLSLGDQIIVVVMAVITAIGAAGVPGGSLPLLIMVLAMVGVPPTGIALILGVDRILDMCRTTLNVIGDVTAAAYVTRSEGYELLTTESATP